MAVLLLVLNTHENIEENYEKESVTGKKKKTLRAAIDSTEISKDLSQKCLKMIHEREFPAAHKRSS